MSDSVSGNICIGAFITKITQHFSINTSNLNSLPSTLLDNTFIKNCKKFKRVNNIWFWKDEVIGEQEGDEDLEHIFEDIDQFQAQEADEG